MSSDGGSEGTSKDTIDYMGHVWDSVKPADEGVNLKFIFAPRTSFKSPLFLHPLAGDQAL